MKRITAEPSCNIETRSVNTPFLMQEVSFRDQARQEKNKCKRTRKCLFIKKQKERNKTQAIELPKQDTVPINLENLIGKPKFNESNPAEASKATAMKIIEHVFERNTGGLLPDIGKIDYTQLESKDSAIGFNEISQPFCDTMILFGIFNKECFIGKGKRKHLKKELCADVLCKINGVLALSELKKVFIRTNLPLPLFTKSRTAIRIRKFLKTSKGVELLKYSKVENEEISNLYVVQFKLDMHKFDLRKVVNSLKKFLKLTLEFGVWIDSIDITTDIIGTMKKQELINELKLTGKINDAARDNSTGRNCITYWCETVIGNIRCKIYNKFVCQLTAGGSVLKKFGSHIRDYLQPEKDLSFIGKLYDDRVKAAGITRLELSLYSYDIYTFEDYIVLLKENLCDLFRSKNLLHKVSLANQWKLIEEKLLSNMMIFDFTHCTAYAAFWGNSETKCITGNYKAIEERKYFPKLCEHFISLFSFVNKPVYCLKVIFDKQEVKIETECWIKIANDISSCYTFAAKGNPFAKVNTAITNEKTCFEGSTIKFGLLTKSLRIKSNPIYPITKFSSQNVEPILIDPEIKKSIEEHNRVEKEQRQRKELKNKAILEEVERLINLAQLEKKLSGIMWAPVGCKSLVDLAKRKERDHGICDHESHYRECCRLEIDIVALIEGINSFLMIGSDNAIYKVPKYIKEVMLSDSNLSYYSASSLKDLLPICCGTIKYYGVLPKFTTKIFAFTVNGTVFIKGCEEPIIFYFSILPGWRMIETKKNKEEKSLQDQFGLQIDKQRNALLEQGVPEILVKKFEYDFTLMNIASAFVHPVEEIPKGTKFNIYSIFKKQFRNKNQYLFKATEMIPNYTGINESTVFKSNTRLSELLDQRFKELTACQINEVQAIAIQCEVLKTDISVGGHKVKDFSITY